MRITYKSARGTNKFPNRVPDDHHYKLINLLGKQLVIR